MLIRTMQTLAIVLGSAFLWAVALGDLAQTPVTHTGTQTHHRVDQ